MAAPIEERYIEVDGIRIFLRERGGDGIPTIWVHGNPTDSQDWLPFIAATDGPAIAPDLPGFGRSERPPPGAFDGTVGAYGRLLADAFARAGARRLPARRPRLGRRSALVAAQARPERVRRLVVINAVPLRRGLPLALGRADLASPRTRRGLQPARARASSPAGSCGWPAPAAGRCLPSSSTACSSTGTRG